MQLNVPGVVLIRAIHNSITVGILIWYVQGEVAHGHLSAYSKKGYKLFAPYALFWHSLIYFQEMGLRWVNFGGSAGVDTKSNNGLISFKRGWTTECRTTYFCGRIFDHLKYSEIVKAKGVSESDYFPAYRMGEFE